MKMFLFTFFMLASTTCFAGTPNRKPSSYDLNTKCTAVSADSTVCSAERGTKTEAKCYLDFIAACNKVASLTPDASVSCTALSGDKTVCSAEIGTKGEAACYLRFEEGCKHYISLP